MLHSQHTISFFILSIPIIKTVSRSFCIWEKLFDVATVNFIFFLTHFWTVLIVLKDGGRQNNKAVKILHPSSMPEPQATENLSCLKKPARGSLCPPTQISVSIRHDSVHGTSLQIYNVMSFLKTSLLILPSASVTFIVSGVSEPSPRGQQSSQVFGPPRHKKQQSGKPRWELSSWQFTKPGWITALEAWVSTYLFELPAPQVRLLTWDYQVWLTEKEQLKVFVTSEKFYWCLWPGSCRIAVAYAARMCAAPWWHIFVEWSV